MGAMLPEARLTLDQFPLCPEQATPAVLQRHPEAKHFRA
jgi:hypothetical protein